MSIDAGRLAFSSSFFLFFHLPFILFFPSPHFQPLDVISFFCLLLFGFLACLPVLT